VNQKSFVLGLGMHILGLTVAGGFSRQLWVVVLRVLRKNIVLAP